MCNNVTGSIQTRAVEHEKDRSHLLVGRASCISSRRSEDSVGNDSTRMEVGDFMRAEDFSSVKWDREVRCDSLA
jgi:hypothetical protein